MSSTGENENDLRKVLDLTRWASVLLLGLHVYYVCYYAFVSWQLTGTFTDQLLRHIAATGLFRNFDRPKLLSLCLLIVGLFGVQGKKDPEQNWKNPVALLSAGATIFFASSIVFRWCSSAEAIAVCYIVLLTIGYLLLLKGGTRVSRLIHSKVSEDIFNEENETFPQEEKLLQNEYSVNFRGKYNLRGKQRDSWINVPNPFRGLIVSGSPGAGKSWFVILPLMKQMIEKGYGMFIYDFKYDDLSKSAYNWLLANRHKYASPPVFLRDKL